jgi:predicted patatin/cPLA2 family phospholipase
MSGGGMTCSYSAGFLGALAKEIGFTKPDIIIASSGSVGSASYYVAGQYDSVTNIWAKHLSTNKFINLARFWRVIDIDYLIDSVFKKIEPLDEKLIYTSKIDYLVPVTNADSGEVRYFTNKDGSDIFEVMRATKAMPVLFNKKVAINGKRYCDTQLASSAYFNIPKALELGATHIIIVANNEKTSTLYDLGYKIWVKSKNKVFRDNYKRLGVLNKKLNGVNGVEILYITPSQALPAKILDNNQVHLRETIDLGYQDCLKSVELITLLKDYT